MSKPQHARSMNGKYSCSNVSSKTLEIIGKAVQNTKPRVDSLKNHQIGVDEHAQLGFVVYFRIRVREFDSRYSFRWILKQLVP